MKGIKIFLNKKKKKNINIIMNIIKIFLKIKDRLVEYRRNYYITHKEYFPGCSTRF